MHISKYTVRKNKARNFALPSWLKPLHQPDTIFDKALSTYSEISKVIRKMKTGASPCPLDQISIIALKKCPILRTYLHKLLCQCWVKRKITTAWKQSVTILAHKKGNADKPENFRPITLEPVLSKIYTSLIRNRIYKFVAANKFIETDIQKSFWNGASGAIEHTDLLSHFLKKSKKNIAVLLSHC